MARANPDNSIHVRLDYPISKRKDILATTIDVVELLKKYEEIKKLRKEKLQALDEFRKVLLDIQKLSREVRLKELPLRDKELEKVKDASGRLVFAPAPKLKKVKKTKKKAVRRRTVSRAAGMSHHAIKKSAIDKQLEELRRKLDQL